MVLYVNNSNHCGYVIVNKEHKYYGEHYSDLPYFDVHGGLTFSGEIDGLDGWALGFDAAHLGDVTATSKYPGDTFKDAKYMITECEILAQQIQEKQ